MTFEELMFIRRYTCAARRRLIDLRKAEIISFRDFIGSCDRFDQTHFIVKQYMDAKDIY